jgi:hypothetical protein
VAYVPGMKTDQFDGYLIQGRVDHCRRYIEAGGDPDKGIAHFLTHDDYLLEPLWGPAIKRRIDGFKALGIKTLVAADYSTWGTWPLMKHLYNYYRSNIVNNDLQSQGFHMVCHPNFTSHKLVELSAEMWEGPCETVLIDAIHSQSKHRDAFVRQYQEAWQHLHDYWPDSDFAVWGRYPRVMNYYSFLGDRAFYVPSFVAMRARYINAVQARVKQRKATGG